MTRWLAPLTRGRLCTLTASAAPVPSIQSRHARTAQPRASFHEVRAHTAARRCVRLPVPPRATRGAAPGPVLRVVSRVREEGRVGTPNGTRGRPQPLAARPQAVLVAVNRR